MNGEVLHNMPRKLLIAPSILSADFAELRREIEKVEAGGADLIHIDVMDGHFVPNITAGVPVVASLRRVTELPLDVHLMISEPARYIEAFIAAGADMISVHCEADHHLQRTISAIKSAGASAGAAINPATPLVALEEVLPELDFVLLMTVNPGFGGQRFLPSSYDKIRRLRDMVRKAGGSARIEVDGGIGAENAARVVECGAEILVAGSAIFSSSDAQAAVAEIRRLAEGRVGAKEPGVLAGE